MNYSKFQEDIFEYIKRGNGNLVISAKAGSGKTTTIINTLQFVKPKQQVLFIAFNKSIVSELKERIKNPQVKIMTLHGLGYTIICNNMEKQPQIDEFKYKRHLLDNIETLSNELFCDFTQKQYEAYIDNVLRLCDLGRAFMCFNSDEIEDIAKKYCIELMGDECRVAMSLIWWGEDNHTTIDFTDMIYLPLVLRLKPYKYDIIYLDEAQDANISQRELMLKCLKQGGRFIAVGDEKQCIYNFAGSDSESFNKLQNHQYTKTLPLSVCYRCPKEVIKFVNKIVPDISASPTAKDGEVKFNCTLNELKDGDMVLCRNTYPLTVLYHQLLHDGKNVYLKGVEVGNTLINLIKQTGKDTIISNNINDGGVMEQLHVKLLKNIDKYAKKLNLQEELIYELPQINSLLDKIKTIEILSEGITNVDDLIIKINTIFNDEESKGICLCTMHKSKGLENEDVYILGPELIPSKSAKTQLEQQQELNLMYVAYTRPKNKLGFIKKGEVKYGFNSNNSDDIINYIRFVKKSVNYL